MTPAEARDVLPVMFPHLAAKHDLAKALFKDLDRAQNRRPAPEPVEEPMPRLSPSERLAALTVPPPTTADYQPRHAALEETYR